jgi:hypothetical protein
MPNLSPQAQSKEEEEKEEKEEEEEALVEKGTKLLPKQGLVSTATASATSEWWLSYRCTCSRRRPCTTSRSTASPASCRAAMT